MNDPQSEKAPRSRADPVKELGTCVFCLRLTEEKSADDVRKTLAKVLGCTDKEPYPQITAAAGRQVVRPDGRIPYRQTLPTL